MARQRLPSAVADAQGAAVKNPGRFKGRGSPKGDGLGEASAEMSFWEAEAFRRFKAELPWLQESDRMIVELASMYRGRVLDPEGKVKLDVLQELRRCLGQLGATPADRSRVSIATDDEEEPEDALFGKPN